jgi:hypothetical protein
VKFKISSAKLTSDPAQSGWAQVHDFEPVDKKKLASRGHFFAVISGQSFDQPGIEKVLAGREVLTRLHEEYFGNTKGSSLEALKSALNKVIAELATTWGSLEIAALALVEGVIYVAVNKGAIFLLRGDNLVRILSSNSQNAISASGLVKPGDSFLLGTLGFFEPLSQEIVKASLQSSHPTASIESLAPLLHTEKQRKSFAGVVVKVDSSETGLIPAIKSQEGHAFPQKPNFKKPNLASFLTRISKRLPKKKFWIKQDTKDLVKEKNRSVAVFVGVILLGLLVVSIGFGIKQKRAQEYKAKYQSRLEQAQHQFGEAKSLASLNSSRARELFMEARALVLALEDEGIVDSELEALKQEIEKSMGEIAGIYQTEPELFLDLSLISQGFKGDDLGLYEERMLVLDREGRKLVSIGVDTKKTKVIAGPDQLSQPRKIAIYDKRNFVVDEDGIREIDQEVKLVIEKSWVGEVLSQAYTANMYLLDRDASRIFRYAASEEGFGSKQEWFGPGVTPDLGQARSLAIDGSVWILLDAGKILKFTYGKPDAFEVQGVDKGIQKSQKLYTSEALQDLYILDPLNSRIVVVTKTGEFRAEYVANNLGQATDLVVSESQKIIIYLTGERLYQIKLEHN